MRYFSSLEKAKKALYGRFGNVLVDYGRGYYGVSTFKGIVDEYSLEALSDLYLANIRDFNTIRLQKRSPSHPLPGKTLSEYCGYLQLHLGKGIFTHWRGLYNADGQPNRDFRPDPINEIGLTPAYLAGRSIEASNKADYSEKVKDKFAEMIYKAKAKRQLI